MDQLRPELGDRIEVEGGARAAAGVSRCSPSAPAWIGLLCLAAAVGCAQGGPAQRSGTASANQDSSRQLDNACRSPFELAQRVLLALQMRDQAMLESLRISEQEFGRYIWPGLPASRPERNVPFDYAWGELDQKSRMSLHRLLSRYGGKRYRLLQVDFAGESTRYGSYVVHRASRLNLMNDRGEQRKLALFGSVVELDRQFKLMSYVTDH